MRAITVLLLAVLLLKLFGNELYVNLQKARISKVVNMHHENQHYTKHYEDIN